MKRGATSIAVLALGGSFASAAITFHEIAHWEVYDQTSAAQPVNPTRAFFTARVFSNVSNEVTTGTVTLPSGQVRNLSPQGNRIAGYSQGGFSNRAAVLAAFGPGTYTFGLNAGPYNGQTDTVNYEDPGWADTVPFMTNYAALAGHNPAQSLTLQWQPFSATGDHTVLVTYLNVFDATTNSLLFGTSGNAQTFTALTLAPGTFQVNRTYRYELTFGSLTQPNVTGGFSPSRATATTYTMTAGQFATVPEPGTMAALGLGAFLVSRRRRQSSRKA